MSTPSGGRQEVNKRLNICKWNILRPSVTSTVLPVGGLQQRWLSADGVSDPQSAAEDSLSVLEDGQGASGHPDERTPSHLGTGLQPSADRYISEGRCLRCNTLCARLHAHVTVWNLAWNYGRICSDLRLYYVVFNCFLFILRHRPWQ